MEPKFLRGNDMKKYLHCIYSDSYSLIYSGRLWIAIIGIIFVNLLNVGNELVSNPLCNVYYLSVMRRSLGGFFIITICFSGVCYSDSHFSAVKNGYFYSEILRKGSNVYCSAKIMTALFFSFLASLLGNLIFILILKSYCIFMIKGEENIEYFLETYRTPFTSLYRKNFPLLFFIADGLPEAMCYGFLSVFVLMISGWCRNIFILYASPLIFYYISLHLFDIFKLPKIFYWFVIMENGVWPEKSCLENLFLTGCYYLTLSILCGCFFKKRVKYLQRKGAL